MIKWPWSTLSPSPAVLADWQDAVNIPLLATLDIQEYQGLINLAQQLLQQKLLVPLQGLELNLVMQQRIALLLALPVLELGIEWLDGFNEIQLYPEPFVVNDDWQDEHGLVHSGPQIQSGISWEQGPLVLNWLEAQDSFDCSGFNLVIHEVAHKLDMRNGGQANGMPPLPRAELRAWELDFAAAMQQLQEEVDLVGEEAASIDPYAASNMAECFAVLSEYFFSAPELLVERFPTLYPHFCGFYRQDPLARLQR